MAVDSSWRAAREVFERAIELSAEERGPFVERACANDDSVRATVERLLAAWSSGAAPLKPLEMGELGRHWIAAATPSVGDRIGAYRIERLLGAGGMGTVYLAEQARPARKVALKLMRSGLGTSDAVRRFEAEADILAHLRHPEIAMIFELGTHTGAAGATPYFAMEFVEGARDLATYCREERLSVFARVKLVLHVCGALQHAHSRGVIHRDLKPGNVLVDDAGRVKVIDFGIARIFRTDSTSAQTSIDGAALGTLVYASPEQLRDDWRDIDVRTDVYSLGATMYEVLAGRPPIEVGNRPLTEVVRDVCEVVPVPPSHHDANLPRELDWIVLRCLEKERERRYANVDEFEADLRRFANGEPVLAGPASRFYLARKFVRRHWLVLGAASIVLVSLTAATTVYRFSMLEARQHETLAISAGELAEREAEAARVALRRESAVVEALNSMLGSVAPEEDGRGVTLFELLERRRTNLETEFAEDPQLRASMQLFLMRAYSNLGLNQQATELGEAALATMESSQAYTADEITPVQFFVARRWFELGRIDDASELIARAESLAAQGGGAMTTDGVAALRMRAMLLEKRGLAAESSRAYERALDAARATLGADDMLTLTLMTDVALDRAMHRHFDAAETLAREAHERAARLISAEHPQLLMFRMRLGSVLAAAGKSDEALALQVEIVERTARLFGEQHRNTVQAHRELAQAYLSAGDIGAACEASERALALADTHHPGDGELAVTVRVTLANALRRAERHAEAAECWTSVIATFESSGRTRDPNLINAKISLASSWIESSRAAEAEAILRATLASAAEFVDPAHSSLGRARLVLARAIAAQDRSAEAYAEFEGAYRHLEACDDGGSKGHARDALVELEKTAAKLGRTDDAARWREKLAPVPREGVSR